MNNISKCVTLDADAALKMLAKLQFEKFKARMAGDEEMEEAYDNEINRLSKALESAVKELENK